MITSMKQLTDARTVLDQADDNHFDATLISVQAIEAEMATLLDMKPETISLMDAVEIEALASRGDEL